jgi:hypothetical protein
VRGYFHNRGPYVGLGVGLGRLEFDNQ